MMDKVSSEYDSGVIVRTALNISIKWTEIPTRKYFMVVVFDVSEGNYKRNAASPESGQSVIVCSRQEDVGQEESGWEPARLSHRMRESVEI